MTVSEVAWPAVSSRMRAKDGDVTTWWNVVAFSEAAQSELLRLDEGDTVSVQGAFRGDIYHPEGSEPRLNLNIVADVVTPLRPTHKKESPPKTKAPTQSKSSLKLPKVRSRAGTPDPDAGGGGRAQEVNLNRLQKVNNVTGAHKVKEQGSRS
jgi:single-stranded DNA-binding protein